MSHCKTMYRLAVAALATTALAAPTAMAMPIDPGTDGTAKDPRQRDMHASTVQPPAVQQEQRTPDAIDRSEPKAPPVYQEQRTPDAIDQSPAPKSPPVYQEQRTPDAIDQSPAPKSPPVYQEQRTPDALDQSPAPKSEPIPAGMPTWPTNPQTLPRPHEPAAVPTSGDGGGGVDWTVPAIALAACLMLGGAFVTARTRLRAARGTAAH